MVGQSGNGMAAGDGVGSEGWVEVAHMVAEGVVVDRLHVDLGEGVGSGCLGVGEAGDGAVCVDGAAVVGEGGVEGSPEWACP